jgi:hypothetical protein
LCNFSTGLKQLGYLDWSPLNTPDISVSRVTRGRLYDRKMEFDSQEGQKFLFTTVSPSPPKKKHTHTRTLQIYTASPSVITGVVFLGKTARNWNWLLTSI